ncbi:MAG: PepSY-associated TM helix domain-containing protein [Pseudomonadota bacterium]
MASVAGSLFRRILFWAHLCSAITAGLFILVMSATGVLLTYEHQMVDGAAHRNHIAAAGGAQQLDADRLAQIARESAPGARPSLVFEADPTAPVTVSRGREGSLLLNPLNGSVIEDASAGQREFFRVVENWHRRLAGNNTSTRAKLIDYGNLLFLFIVTSGIYIWLPQLWRWRNLRGLMFFQAKYINGKVRDFNWHHVLGFWMLIPLFVISLSGVVMSFEWANQLVYAAYGEEAPQRRGGPGAQGPGEQRNRGDNAAAAEPAPRASLESLRQAAITQTPGWNRLTLPLAVEGPQVDISLELKSTERRAPRQTVVLNTTDASVIRVQPPQATPQTGGQRARNWMRFAHTGEQYGIIGQTIAGIASLAACFLAYTGLALAWRRLIRPLFRRAAAA